MYVHVSDERGEGRKRERESLMVELRIPGREAEEGKLF
jgi:hypothetical protein